LIWPCSGWANDPHEDTSLLRGVIDGFDRQTATLQLPSPSKPNLALWPLHGQVQRSSQPTEAEYLREHPKHSSGNHEQFFVIGHTTTDEQRSVTLLVLQF